MSNIQNKIDELFLCPISQEILTEPVIASDGNTYQRKSITEWFRRGKRKSPVTGEIIENNHINDNHIVKEIIMNFIKKNPDVASYIQSAAKPDYDSCISKIDESLFIKEFERNYYAEIESNKLEIEKLNLSNKNKKEEISKMKESNLLLVEYIELNKEKSKHKLKGCKKYFKKK